MPRRATVVGGGIGGLTAAVALRRDGWDVRVLERAEGPERTGTALGMWPTAVKALDEVGLGDALRDLSTEQAAGDLLRPDGSVIARVSSERLRRRTGEPIRVVPRPALLALLSGAVGDVRYGTVGSVDPDADLVVVADGTFSATRASLFGPRFAARYTGNTAWRGTAAIALDHASETWGAGARFGITGYRDGRTNWYASAAAPEGARSPGAEVAVLREIYGGWHDPVPRLLDALVEDDVLRHDLYALAPPLPSYVRGNAALIGDAAHAMTPDLGRGACEAIVDAITLAACLRDGDGLAGYDRRRRRPTQRLAAMSSRMARLAHARRLTGLRDGTLKVALMFSLGNRRSADPGIQSAR